MGECEVAIGSVKALYKCSPFTIYNAVTHYII